MSPPPFPPVVRWALFPALAGLAGAAGGALGLALTRDANARLIVIAGSLSAGAGLGSMLGASVWARLFGAPVLGVLMASAGAALVESLERGGPVQAWSFLARVLSQLDGLILLSWVPFTQAIVHRTTSVRGGLRGLALGLVFGLLTFGIAAGIGAPTFIGLLLAFAIVAQVPAVLAAGAVARRLRPPEAA